MDLCLCDSLAERLKGYLQPPCLFSWVSLVLSLWQNMGTPTFLEQEGRTGQVLDEQRQGCLAAGRVGPHPQSCPSPWQ